MKKIAIVLGVLISGTAFAGNTVKAILESNASEREASEAKAAAESKTGRAADIIRDVDGKVLEVRVSLPENDNAGIEKAKAALIENSGVATVLVEQTKPNGIFDELIPGSILTEFSSNGKSIKLGGAYVAAEASEAFGGVGSALKLIDSSQDPATNPWAFSMDANMSVKAPDYGTSLFSSINLSGDIKIIKKNAYDGRLDVSLGGLGYSLLSTKSDIWINNFNGNWIVKTPDVFDSWGNYFPGEEIDSGVLLTEFLNFSVSRVGDVTTVKIKTASGEFSHSNTRGDRFETFYPLMMNQVNYVFEPFEQNSIVIDNLSVDVQ